MELEKITIGELKELMSLFGRIGDNGGTEKRQPHPMLGKRCIVRTYSAGVHIGTVKWVNPQDSREVLLTDALRLWRWDGGGLSLSAVANNGIKGGRLNRTGEVYLTEVIEYIPTTDKAEATYEQFIEE